MKDDHRSHLHPFYEGLPELTNDIEKGGAGMAVLYWLIGLCTGAAVIMVLILLWPRPASAQTLPPPAYHIQATHECHPASTFIDHQESVEGERVQQLGVTPAGDTLLLFVNPHTGSFTMALQLAEDGAICPMVSRNGICRCMA